MTPGSIVAGRVAGSIVIAPPICCTFSSILVGMCSLLFHLVQVHLAHTDQLTLGSSPILIDVGVQTDLQMVLAIYCDVCEPMTSSSLVR